MKVVRMFAEKMFFKMLTYHAESEDGGDDKESQELFPAVSRRFFIP